MYFYMVRPVGIEPTSPGLQPGAMTTLAKDAIGAPTENQTQVSPVPRVYIITILSEQSLTIYPIVRRQQRRLLICK